MVASALIGLMRWSGHLLLLLLLLLPLAITTQEEPLSSHKVSCVHTNPALMGTPFSGSLPRLQETTPIPSIGIPQVVDACAQNPRPHGAGEGQSHHLLCNVLKVGQEDMEP